MDVELSLERREFPDKSLVLLVDFVSYVFDPIQLSEHLLLLVQILVVLLGLTNFILFELFLDLAYFLVKKATDV